ncbi:MAG TPA: hypothetical protein K8V84_22245 [Nocardiopsis listeri]|uniref:hypothetical protein n=1 Tax=Nocardiopsis listeri TaxID=53440 RepID=UPI001DB705A9|nr:hypothetical protein [Nocardiopsis listeri]HJE61203.1 hypothetical protein [Nocardiopsis listeri]
MNIDVPGLSESFESFGLSSVHPTASTSGATRSDELVEGICRLLEHPGRPAHAARTLARADRLFSELDRRIRSGEPLPSTWLASVVRSSVPPDERGIAYDYATHCYDSVSEALREAGGVVAAWRALAEAGRYWRRLNDALVERSPLPEPWLREPLRE